MTGHEARGSILLLEDDPNLGLIVQEHLKLNGYRVCLCVDGAEGLKAYAGDNFDLCLVDIMMPKMDGITFTHEIRGKGDDIPIIFLTAKSLQEDKIEGFKAGCDDYLTKPFSVEELLLRIQAILKRVQKDDKDSGCHLFEIGTYKFDSRKRLLSWKKQDYKLTTKEAELLRLLCLNLNRTLERNTALEKIWSDESYFSGRSMDVFISKLRKYLKDDPNIDIVNVHGKGFKLVVNS